MKAYQIGLYEKALRKSLSWREAFEVTKECGYDYFEMTIDATEERISRVFETKKEWKKISDAAFDADLPVRSMSVSALTKFALGDPSEEIRERGVFIARKSIEMSAFLGVRTVMIPGYDIYFGESTEKTKAYFRDNIKRVTEFAAKEGVLLGFETMENNFMNTTKKAVYWVTKTGSPYLKIYPDSGNITNAAMEEKKDVCEDLRSGKGLLVALHLKESKPGVFREVPFFSGHVDFERIISEAWKLGVRRFVTEMWDVGKDSWKEDILFANKRMRSILDKMEKEEGFC